MIRNSKTPTFVIIGLCVLLLIFVYKYWNLSDQNNFLSERLISNEDKLSNLNEKKAYLEKQGDIASGKIKLFEEKINSYSDVMVKKDAEIAELRVKLKEKTQDYQNQIKEIADLNSVIKVK
jgi:chromosome segregation ATPase